MSDQPMSDDVHQFDVRSLDPEYLSACVRFAQSHGIFPTSHGHEHDNSLLFPDQDVDPDLIDSDYTNPPDGNTFAGPSHSQHNYGNHSDPFSASWDNDATYRDSQIDDAANYSEPQPFRPSDSSVKTVTEGNTLHCGPPPPAEHLQEPASGQMSYMNGTGKQGLAVRHNYDPFWVQKTGADPRSVFETRSKMKFESLFYHGVIQKGDCLVVAVACNTNGVIHQDVASFMYTGFSMATDESGRQRRYPDLTLTLRQSPNNPHHNRTLLACKGTRTILQTFHNLHITGPNVSHNALAANMNVWRGDHDLGSLEYVKQAYHTWKNKMDTECERSETKWRTRKADDGNKTLREMEERTEEGREKGLKRFLSGVPGAEA